jgi:hypothetical protein
MKDVNKYSTTSSRSCYIKNPDCEDIQDADICIQDNEKCIYQGHCITRDSCNIEDWNISEGLGYSDLMGLESRILQITDLCKKKHEMVNTLENMKTMEFQKLDDEKKILGEDFILERNIQGQDVTIRTQNEYIMYLKILILRNGNPDTPRTFDLGTIKRRNWNNLVTHNDIYDYVEYLESYEEDYPPEFADTVSMSEYYANTLGDLEHYLRIINGRIVLAKYLDVLDDYTNDKSQFETIYNDVKTALKAHLMSYIGHDSGIGSFDFRNENNINKIIYDFIPRINTMSNVGKSKIQEDLALDGSLHIGNAGILKTYNALITEYFSILSEIRLLYKANNIPKEKYDEIGTVEWILNDKRLIPSNSDAYFPESDFYSDTNILDNFMNFMDPNKNDEANTFIIPDFETIPLSYFENFRNNDFKYVTKDMEEFWADIRNALGDSQRYIDLYEHDLDAASLISASTKEMLVKLMSFDTRSREIKKILTNASSKEKKQFDKLKELRTLYTSAAYKMTFNDMYYTNSYNNCLEMQPHDVLYFYEDNFEGDKANLVGETHQKDRYDKIELCEYMYAHIIPMQEGMVDNNSAKATLKFANGINHQDDVSLDNFNGNTIDDLDNNKFDDYMAAILPKVDVANDVQLRFPGFNLLISSDTIDENLEVYNGNSVFLALSILYNPNTEYVDMLLQMQILKDQALVNPEYFEYENEQFIIKGADTDDNVSFKMPTFHGLDSDKKKLDIVAVHHFIATQNPYYEFDKNKIDNDLYNFIEEIYENDNICSISSDYLSIGNIFAADLGLSESIFYNSDNTIIKNMIWLLNDEVSKIVEFSKRRHNCDVGLDYDEEYLIKLDNCYNYLNDINYSSANSFDASGRQLGAVIFIRDIDLAIKHLHVRIIGTVEHDLASGLTTVVETGGGSARNLLRKSSNLNLLDSLHYLEDHIPTSELGSDIKHILTPRKVSLSRAPKAPTKTFDEIHVHRASSLSDADLNAIKNYGRNGLIHQIHTEQLESGTSGLFKGIENIGLSVDFLILAADIAQYRAVQKAIGEHAEYFSEYSDEMISRMVVDSAFAFGPGAGVLVKKCMTKLIAKAVLKMGLKVVPGGIFIELFMLTIENLYDSFDFRDMDDDEAKAFIQEWLTSSIMLEADRIDEVNELLGIE